MMRRCALPSRLARTSGTTSKDETEVESDAAPSKAETCTSPEEEVEVGVTVAGGLRCGELSTSYRLARTSGTSSKDETEVESDASPSTVGSCTSPEVEVEAEVTVAGSLR